jgi:hypothetical protein
VVSGGQPWQIWFDGGRYRFSIGGSSDGSRISARAVRVALAFVANGSAFGVVDD